LINPEAEISSAAFGDLSVISSTIPAVIAGGDLANGQCWSTVRASAGLGEIILAVNGEDANSAEALSILSPPACCPCRSGQLAISNISLTPLISEGGELVLQFDVTNEARPPPRIFHVGAGNLAPAMLLRSAPRSRIIRP